MMLTIIAGLRCRLPEYVLRLMLAVTGNCQLTQCRIFNTNCLLVGGVSAAVSKTAAAPIERIKLLIQNQVGYHLSLAPIELGQRQIITLDCDCE
jgi:hypothetical protein